jgi:hypothetical protein
LAVPFFFSFFGFLVCVAFLKAEIATLDSLKPRLQAAPRLESYNGLSSSIKKQKLSTCKVKNKQNFASRFVQSSCFGFCRFLRASVACLCFIIISRRFFFSLDDKNGKKQARL